MTTLKASGSEMEALIKPGYLRQTLLDINKENYSNPKIKILTSIKPMEAAICILNLTSCKIGKTNSKNLLEAATYCSVAESQSHL